MDSDESFWIFAFVQLVGFQAHPVNLEKGVDWDRVIADMSDLALRMCEERNRVWHSGRY